MVSDLDTYRAATLVIQQHGADALIEAAQMIDRMLAKRRRRGRLVWRRINWLFPHSLANLHRRSLRAIELERNRAGVRIQVHTARAISKICNSGDPGSAQVPAAPAPLIGRMRQPAPTPSDLEAAG